MAELVGSAATDAGRKSGQPAWQQQRSWPPRIALVVIIVVVTVYSVAVLTGTIAKDNRIDLAHLALLACAGLVVLVVVQPEVVSGVRKFKVGSLELEMLEQVKETRNEVRDLRLVLPLLLPEVEQKHLLNLAGGVTNRYRGNSELRGELRRLRYMGLIRMKGTGFIADLKDGHEFDLTDYVVLTDLGQRWVTKIRQMANDHYED